jgi:hypothetical protein
MQQTKFHAISRIRTRDPCNQAATDLHFYSTATGIGISDYSTSKRQKRRSSSSSSSSNSSVVAVVVVAAAAVVLPKN